MYCRCVGLALNIDKTEIIILSGQHAERHCTVNKVAFNRRTLPAAKKLRNLAVMMDRDLSMKSHVSKTRSSAFSWRHRKPNSVSHFFTHLSSLLLTTVHPSYMGSQHLTFINSKFTHLKPLPICHS